jgi:hypothetical protein
MRRAIISLAICSPRRTPASYPSVTMSVRAGSIDTSILISGYRVFSRSRAGHNTVLTAEDMAAIEARLAGIEVIGERLPPDLLQVTYR